MNKTKAITAFLSSLTFVVCVSFSTNIRAQDNILADLSYLYLEKLVATAKENYPRVKNFNSQVAVAKSDLAGAKVSWLDPFSFQYVFRSNDANRNVVDVKTADILDGYQFGVAINPGTLLAKPSQIKRAKEQLKIAEYNQDEYSLQLESEVKRRYFLYLQNKNSLLSNTKAFLDAEANYKNIKAKYEKAEVTFSDYNSASISYNQAVLAKIQAETNLLTAKVALEELTVKKLEEIK
jgi:outer membrane protein TolC